MTTEKKPKWWTAWNRYADRLGKFYDQLPEALTSTGELSKLMEAALEVEEYSDSDDALYRAAKKRVRAARGRVDDQILKYLEKIEAMELPEPPPE